MKFINDVIADEDRKNFYLYKKIKKWRLRSYFILIFSLNFVGKNAISAVNSTHCATDEVVVFSCSFKNKKTISLCASPDLSEKNGTMQYRYGFVGKKLDLLYPNSVVHPSEKFKLYSERWARGHHVEIGFDISEYSYLVYVYENIETYEKSFSLAAFLNKNKIFEMDCLNSKNIIDNTYSIEGYGIPNIKSVK